MCLSQSMSVWSLLRGGELVLLFCTFSQELPQWVETFIKQTIDPPKGLILQPKLFFFFPVRRIEPSFFFSLSI